MINWIKSNEQEIERLGDEILPHGASVWVHDSNNVFITLVLGDEMYMIDEDLGIMSQSEVTTIFSESEVNALFKFYKELKKLKVNDGKTIKGVMRR